MEAIEMYSYLLLEVKAHPCYSIKIDMPQCFISECHSNASTPRGSFLGPLLFFLYRFSQEDLVHYYKDDSHLQQWHTTRRYFNFLPHKYFNQYKPSNGLILIPLNAHVEVLTPNISNVTVF